MPARAVAATTTFPNHTTPTVAAWTRSPFQRDPDPERALLDHQSDPRERPGGDRRHHARGAGRRQPLATPIAAASEATPPNRNRSARRRSAPHRSAPPTPAAGRARRSANRRTARQARSKGRNSSQRIRLYQQGRPDSQASTSAARRGLSPRDRPPGRGGRRQPLRRCSRWGGVVVRYLRPRASELTHEETLPTDVTKC